MKNIKTIITIVIILTINASSVISQENKKSAALVIEKTINDNGLAEAQKKFNNILSDRGIYEISESEFNTLGYKFLSGGKLSVAIEIFKMNVKLFPESTNVYDSQGEAYLYLGDIPKAIASYSKIREIDNGNTSGVRIIENINKEYLFRQQAKLSNFHSAAKTGNLESLKCWLNANPDFLNTKTADGNTALYLAVYGKHLDIVKYLVSAGADLNARNILGQSAYNLADFCKFNEIKDFLISKNISKSPQEFPLLESKYLGQEVPGLTPKIFAQGIVSSHKRVYGNIVFSPDFKEACWTPNEPNNDHRHGGLITSKYMNGTWAVPKEILYMDSSYSHRSPFYSYDGKRLYFQSHLKENRGFDQKEKFYFVTKTEEAWSEPSLLDTIFNKYGIHWQFSLDNNNNLYFGGKLRGNENSKGIYFSKNENGKYKEPELIFESQKLKDHVIGPAISPNGDYILFTRVHPRGYPSPFIFSMYVSFKNTDGSWFEPTDLGDVLKMDANQTRISSDGKYIFFISNGQSFWVDAKIIEELKPKNLK